ncbi:hypothetical protein Tco_0984760 [Tanacetum coccineum]
MFIKYSTGHIPPKKSRGKGSQGKKTGDVSQESVDVFEESEREPAKKKTGSRSTKGVVIQDPPSAPKPKPAASKLKIKGVQSLTPEEQEAADTMQALKESKKTSRRQSGIGTKPGVLDEENVISKVNVIFEWGSKNESEHSDDSQLNFDVKEKKDNDGDAEDEGDHHISDIQDTDDKDAETEFDEDEIYKYKIYVRKDVDVKMGEAKTKKKGDAELAGNVMTSDYQVKVSTEFPLPSFSLFVSSGFGTQFLYSSSDISLTVIPKTTDLPPIPKILTETPVSTAISPPHVTPTILIVEQTTTPIPTPPITIDAPTITTAIPESNALTNVQLRVTKLEKDVSELKKIDHSTEALSTLNKIQKPTIDLEQESKKSASEIHKIKMEQAEKLEMPKYTIKFTDKAALKEYDQKSALYQTMHENTSFNRNPTNNALFHVLMEALIEDENAMDKGVADTVKNHKRQHDDDDDDDDPSAGPNQGKAPSKGSKTDKSTSAKEPVDESIAEVAMDDAVNIAGEDVVHDDDQPQDTSQPKTYKTPNQDWFKQPPRPPTPDPE